MEVRKQNMRINAEEVNEQKCLLFYTYTFAQITEILIVVCEKFLGRIWKINVLPDNKKVLS